MFHSSGRNYAEVISYVFRLLASTMKQGLDFAARQSASEATSVAQVVQNASQSSRKSSLDTEVDMQINLGKAALFTTATTCFHVLYQLAMRPESIDSSRKEIADVVNGTMDRLGADKLVKLDSFIRETQRWCSLSQRKSLSCDNVSSVD